MTPVLSREQVRALDAFAIDACHVPSIVLMENAGRGAADAIVREYLKKDRGPCRIEIVCGTGNNGGDGFVVARRLLIKGHHVRAWLVGQKKNLSPDARINHDAFVGVGGDVHIDAEDDDLARALHDADVVVDGLFGTGLDRPIQKPFVAVIEAMNASRGNRVALDIPSGLNADTGAGDIVVNADLTVTFAHLKMGLLTARGAKHTGKVRVVDIGIPSSIASSVGTVAHVVGERDLREWITARPVDANKYSVGHVAAFAGSPGKTGAALMVAHGALRAGAGAVTIATWPDAAAALESRVVEVMTSGLSTKALAASVASSLKGKRAVVIGPGFGTGRPARTAIETVLASWSGPLVVDADSFTIFAGEPQAFTSTNASLIFTPHAGELARLLATKSETIEADRLASVREGAEKTRGVVVLKGAFTLIASPDGRVAVNRTGTSALAVAGSGDTLAGIIAAFACTLPPFEAACAGVFVHGRASEVWSAKHGDRGMLATEIADHVPDVIAALAHTALTESHAKKTPGHMAKRPSHD
jgi:hydroxyethylthiazole kinase-like uncharacterized protein yjeF